MTACAGAREAAVKGDDSAVAETKVGLVSEVWWNPVDVAALDDFLA